MSPLDPAKKTQKEQLIPKGVKPEKISEEELEESKIEEERFEEQIKEAREAVKEQSAETLEEALDLESSQHLQAQTAAPADPQLKAIQDVMQEDIYEMYSQLSPADQKKFREEGKKVAVEVKSLLTAVKVNVKRIVELIRGWLSRLPGINKYFIEQESKIKLDKLLEIKKQREEQTMRQMEQIEKK